MKKILSMLIMITLIFGTLTALCGLPVSAEADLTTEVWNPVEITFTSTEKYDKPYISTEIDAVFKHSDGTTITLPGFWKEGDTWAVRFSPTKTGTWTYEVTCKDEKNTGLNGSGTIQATETTSENAINKHGFVKVEKDVHYYMYNDGTPFFWLGDTNWQAFSNVSTEVCNYPGCTCGNQFKHIVDDRVEKGFTVYQTYFVPGSGNGEKSVWADGKYERPNTDVFNNKVDEMFKYLHEKGMVTALGLGCHNATMSSNGWDADTYLRFARYIVARYACYSMVWISGQEITNKEPAAEKGKTVFEAYCEMSAYIEELDGYKHPNSAHMYPASATGTEQIVLDTSSWHDSWTVQGGHGGNAKAKDMYMSYYISCLSGKFKPFIEAEVNYEDINCGGFTGYDANRWSAWKAILCGSAGFTYGVTGIWANCFSTKAFTGWFDGKGGSYNYEPWYMGLNKPGSYEMTYMKNFFETIPEWYNLVPKFKNTNYGDFLSDEKSVLSSTEDSSTVVAYFYDSRSTETGTLKNLNKEGVYTAYWFNPLTGKFIKIADNIKADNGVYTIPQRPNTLDWVFVMTTKGIGAHYEEENFVDLNPNYDQVAVEGNLIPADKMTVTAIGGITYKGGKKAAQEMTDNTSWLYDNDPETVWTPFIDRPTQTILFDLGTVQNLAHITINPKEGTIIPRFRVEGSNDLEHWTIITNTEARSAKNPGAGSEPLQGAFRYVKVLLLNADTLGILENEVDSQPYECYWNEETKNAYSVTKITDISLYSFGEGQAKAEIFVEGSGKVTLPGIDNGGNIGDPVVGKGANSTGVTIAIMCMVTVTIVFVIFSLASIRIMLVNHKKKNTNNEE